MSDGQTKIKHVLKERFSFCFALHSQVFKSICQFDQRCIKIRPMTLPLFKEVADAEPGFRIRVRQTFIAGLHAWRDVFSLSGLVAPRETTVEDFED